MSIAAIAAALAPTRGRQLLNWARKLGRLILERLAKRAGRDAVIYFEAKADAWERRRMRLLPKITAAKGKSIRVKLVRQHQAAMRLAKLFLRFGAWLRRHLDEITPAAVRAYCRASKAVISRIPLKSKDEVACTA